MRNLDYMTRFLKRSPTFVWLSRLSLPPEDIDEAFEIGIEFYHANSIEALKQFIEEEFLDDIFVVTDMSKLSEAKLNVKSMMEVKNLYVYCPSQYDRHALSEKDKKMAFTLFNELYSDIEFYQNKSYEKNNPKFFPQKNLIENCEHNRQYYRQLLGKKINRLEGKKKITKLA